MKKDDVFCAIVYIVCVLSSAVVIKKNMETWALYTIISTLSLCLIWLSQKEKYSRYEKILYWAGIFLFSTLYAFRKNIGIDDWTYEQEFLLANNRDYFQFLNLKNIEKGYMTLEYLLYYLTHGNYLVAQFVISEITFILWGIAIKMYKENCSIPFIWFLFWSNYYLLIMKSGLVRMFIAMPLILMSIKFLEQNKIKKYILLIIIASLFHRSALFMLILFCAKIKKLNFYLNWKNILIGLFFAIPICLSLFVMVVVPYMGDRYQIYNSIGNFSLRLNQFDMVPIVVLSLIEQKHIKTDSRKLFIISIVLLFINCILCFWQSIINFGRLTFYTNFGVLIIGGIIKKNKMGDRKIAIMPYLFLIYGQLYLVHTCYMDWKAFLRLFPYKSFFNL